MTAPVCFLGTETTGLHPDHHQIWEVALITPNGDEHVWQFPFVETDADPIALEIGHYWDRGWDTDTFGISRASAIYDAHREVSRRKNFPDEGLAIKPGDDWCRHFRDLTAGCHLAGAVVSFDEERLRRLLWRFDVLPRWHYHLIDVENLAAGWIVGQYGVVEEAERAAVELPWNSEKLSLAVGVDPGEFDRHTALGDARWAKAIYRAVMGE